MIDFSDVQGILLSGYPRLPYSAFLLLRFNDEKRAREWVGEIAGQVAMADQPRPETTECVHVAFTYAGFEKLRLCHQALNGFSREFQEGMTGSDRRRRILGDEGDSDPSKWRWGGSPKDPIHAMLMLYAPSAPALEALKVRQSESAKGSGVEILKHQPPPGEPLAQGKEHFGFRDGISQPKLRGVSKKEDPLHTVNLGEFVLGYENEHTQYTARPLVDPIEDTGNVLPAATDNEKLRDFAKNGSYLVFRQLSQNVDKFWSYIQGQTQQDVPESIRLASKMVGRWPGGTPLVESHDKDRPNLAMANSFRYHEPDQKGLKCPLGAHVRRTNPRDMLEPGAGTEVSLEINRRHRILRRGRSYGPPVADSMDTEEIIKSAPESGDQRGLLFLCFSGNISRQFEFVQHTWANNPNFGGLHAETDPIIGDRPEDATTFTVQTEPVRTRCHGVDRFVEVKGGAYFFLPGKKALRYLAQEPRKLATKYSAPAARPVELPDTIWLKLGRATNNLLESGISLTRRATTLRNILDALFQEPITNCIQWWIQRRRRKWGVDSDLGIAEEREFPREQEITQRITQEMTAFLFKHYRDGKAERAGNTKTYGLLKATFQVEPDLPPELRRGVFAEERAYPAWMRFGGPGPLATPDIKSNGILSIGIKLTGVHGSKLMDQEHETQDFTGISGPTFTTPNVLENIKLQRNIGAGTPTFYFLNPFDSHYLDMILQGLYAKAYGSPFEARYWSCVPYLLGEGTAMKYSIVPHRKARTRVPFPAPDNYLREAMVKTLTEDVKFDFMVQLQEDPQQMPLEDASVIWPSKFTKMATLTIAPQDFANDERDLLARQMSFNPWHAIPDHRPLGNQNRARKYVYLETSKVRQKIRGEQHVEPTEKTP